MLGCALNICMCMYMPLGMRTIRADGNDFFAVYNVSQRVHVHIQFSTVPLCGSVFHYIVCVHMGVVFSFCEFAVCV